MGVSEIVSVTDGEYVLREIFGFRQEGLDSDGVAKGHFYTTGYRPVCTARFADAGLEISDDIFTAS